MWHTARVFRRRPGRTLPLLAIPSPMLARESPTTPLPLIRREPEVLITHRLKQLTHSRARNPLPLWILLKLHHNVPRRPRNVHILPGPIELRPKKGPVQIPF